MLSDGTDNWRFEKLTVLCNIYLYLYLRDNFIKKLIDKKDTEADCEMALSHIN